LWISLVLLLAAPASALVIEPGQVLEAPFTLTGPTGSADTLTFRLVSVSAVDVSTMTVQLYDGATLLGTVTSVPVAGVAGFVDAGSLWTTNAVGTDLSSVRDGSIAGTIRVIPDFLNAGASLTADVSTITSFAVGFGTDAATIVPLSDVLSVGVASVVPEPGSAALLGAALTLWVRRRRPAKA
jgi:hypothetical protein